MNLRRTIFRAANQMLGQIGLSVQPIVRDFDARIVQPEILARMFSALANAFDEWVAQQSVFTPRSSFDTANAVAAFYDSYLASIHRSQAGGSRFNNLLSLFLIAKSASPTVIIDSGTFTGSSAWAMNLGCPNAELYSFDIDLSRLPERDRGVHYLEQDWTTFDWSRTNLENSLVYFDDHVDQALRLIQAAEAGLPLAIFDDDFTFGGAPQMAHGGFALPKIEFLLDDALDNQTELQWVVGSKEFSWAVPHEKMARARMAIAETSRLPNTSLITGIHQTPYRLVRVNVDRQI